MSSGVPGGVRNLGPRRVRADGIGVFSGADTTGPRHSNEVRGSGLFRAVVEDRVAGVKTDLIRLYVARHKGVLRGTAT